MVVGPEAAVEWDTEGLTALRGVGWATGQAERRGRAFTGAGTESLGRGANVGSAVGGSGSVVMVGAGEFLAVRGSMAPVLAWRVAKPD